MSVACGGTAGQVGGGTTADPPTVAGNGRPTVRSVGYAGETSNRTSKLTRLEKTALASSPSERGGAPAFTEELAAMRVGLTAEEYRWKAIRKLTSR